MRIIGFYSSFVCFCQVSVWALHGSWWLKGLGTWVLSKPIENPRVKRLALGQTLTADDIILALPRIRKIP